jgi:hypothetical protein
MTFHFRGLRTLLFVSALVTVSAYAADDPFVGTWKLEPNKIQFAGQVIEIKDLGGNRYVENGSTPREYIAAGEDHPFPRGGTYSIDKESTDRWVFTYKHDGSVTGHNVWTLSNGGQQFKLELKRTMADGSLYTQVESLSRVGSGSGFAGKWQTQTVEVTPLNFVIKPYGNNGLAFATPSSKEHQEMRFDGKDYPDLGPDVRPGDTSCAKRIDQHTIQMTKKLNGKVTSTQEWVVSPDGMTFTITNYATGQTKPIVEVFAKQM